MSPLYKKLLLWFCAANIAVLLVSVFVTDRIGRYVSGNEPDWDAIAGETLASYEANGLIGLAAFNDLQRRTRSMDVALYRDGVNLMQRKPPPPLRPFLQQLLAADALVLQAGEGRWLASRTLTTSKGERLQFIAFRGVPPPHARRNLLLFVQVALSLLVIAALGFVLARSLTAPIAAIQHATRKMADGDLTARADSATATRGDELGALARDFNHMAARTETLVNQQRTVLQDVSHELRSPLARLHLLLELARQGSSDNGNHQLDRAAKEVSRLDDLIGEVLNLSRLETVLPGMSTVPVNLATLAQEVLEEHALEADARQLNMQLHAITTYANGDPGLLARALGNIVGNAIKFSANGSAIALDVSIDNGMASLTVRDHGPGVPVTQLKQLFQPFYRGDNASRAEGHGLGLAIAQRIVTAHGGRIEASNADGGGLAVRIILPVGANHLVG
ncbi:MAG: HAMP domain-containing sensor histidine kinase [Pseudomonadota bacterium]